MDNDFADWLQKELDKRGWSQSDLATTARIHRQVISTYINRRRKKPDPEVLQAIARAFNLPPEFVFQKAFLGSPVSIEQATLDELKQIVRELPPEQIAELLEIGHMKVKNARKKLAGDDK